ncbi:DUF559 domain-containing protein [Bellilinea caldifistulae]|uniref:DUF559 domain-containing protein n=1 Tax=Bellilinea caldifistulae TaxID=360411 RepID=UPI003AFB0B08
MRQNLTRAERRLRAHLRAHRCLGAHCRVQHPSGQFSVDFGAARRRPVIEGDGSPHPGRVRRSPQPFYRAGEPPPAPAPAAPARTPAGSSPAPPANFPPCPPR